MTTSNGSSWVSRQHAWQMKVDEELARKSLDLPDRPKMTVINGIGWKELLAIAAIIAGCVWAMQFIPSTPPTAPADAAYDVTIYDADGNIVRLDEWPGK